jgi:PAS domain S-box-containing protein
MGRDLRYLVVEGSLPPVLGMERQGLEGQTIDEALEVELRRIVQERWRRALAGETASYDWEYRGRVLWSHYVPLKDDSGGIPAAMCLSLDITDRKRAEEALRESETLYRLLFSLAPSGVVLNDADGRIVAFNDRAHEQLGYTRDEFGRMSISDVDADEEPDDVRCRVAEIAAAGGAEYEVHHRAKSGEIRNVLVETRPIDVGGERRFLSVWQDITDRKRVEEALREMDRRKSEFLAVLSHELRNPLAPIRNSIYLLDRAAPGSRQAARAREVILRQTEQLSRLVDDLLDVTRISRGKVTLNRVGVDLRDVVRHTCDDHRSLFEGSEVELRVEAPASPVWIDADATRISQVLGNLLQNAVKFTPSGGGVMVGVRARADHAELSVRDNGIGMNPDQVERMFEPFAQAEQGLARTTGGLGLGLALVKGLVELHGGSVHARSEGLGRGSEFVVSLPLVLQPRAKLAATPVIAPATPGRHVLIIEDNVDAGQVLAAILELGGHSVRVARDGRSGVAMARELKPDVVVCDIGLPDVDGYEVARMLRAEEGLRATRLIAISGYAQPEDKQRAKDAGFDAHLAKPASLDELNALLAAPGGAAA